MVSERLLVLWVDDDEGAGRALARTLRWSRVDIVPATGVAALTLLRMDRVDVVAAGAVLRDRRGLQLLDDVAALAPRVGRVLCGFDTDAVVDAALRRRRIHAFLRQPFCADDVVAAAAAAAGRAGAVDEGHPLTVH